MARGEFLLCLDADDVIGPTYLEKCVKQFREHPETDLVYCRWRYFGAQTGSPELSYPGYESLLIVNRIFVSAMMRTDAFRVAGGFDEQMKNGLEDWEFWIRFLSPASVVFQIPEELFYYRIKAASKNREAHEGIVPFEIQMYILNKHKELYNSIFGSPILAIAKEHYRAERLQRKYDHVFYRRFWKWLIGIGLLRGLKK